MHEAHDVHDLASIDLNLLRVLDALLAERHLTRAGKRLGLSQSATSHALARLRQVFGDRLFVRTSRGLTATARAERLGEPVREAMRAMSRCFGEPDVFVPSTAERTFNIATADYASFVLVPKILDRLTAEAPLVDLWIRNVATDFHDQLALGEADLVISPGRNADAPVAIRSRALYRERFVCLVRKGHPLVKKTLDLATWTTMRHVFIAPRGTPGGVVDETLAQLGRKRRVALGVPHFLVAPHVVASSDLVLTVGARVAEAFEKLLPVRIVEPPVKLPGFEVRMFWHERQHHDEGQRWLREVVSSVVG